MESPGTAPGSAPARRRRPWGSWSTRQAVILVDAGAGTWYGGSVGVWRAASAARAIRRNRSTSSWSRTPPLRSRRRPHYPRRRSGLPNAEVYVAQAESDFWLSPEISPPRRRGCPAVLRERASHRRPVHQGRQMAHVQGTESIVGGMQIVPLRVIPPACRLRIFVTGEKILFWGDIVHAQRVQLKASRGHGGLRRRPRGSCMTRNRLLHRPLRRDV